MIWFYLIFYFFITYFKVIIDGLINPFLSSNASVLEPFESIFIGPDDDELGWSTEEPEPDPELGEIEDLLILRSSFVAMASHIKGDKSEKFASNSLIDPS